MRRKKPVTHMGRTIQRRFVFIAKIKIYKDSSAIPPLAVLDSGVLEMSSKDPMERECSADGRFRGGKGDMSVSRVS